MKRYLNLEKLNSHSYAAMREAIEFFMDPNSSLRVKETIRNENDLFETVLSIPMRNVDRFQTEQEAQIAFLNEVRLIDVDNLNNDPFDKWTNEMKKEFSSWLFKKIVDKQS